MARPALIHLTLPVRALTALFAGALSPLALSPNNMWLLGFVSVAGLYLALKHASPKTGALLGWLFGLGFFGVGTSWVYVSINIYGNASGPFAALLTGLFVAGLALFFLLQGWLLQRFFNRSFYIFSFSALWILGEWFRGWFLTGFPWLYLGYAHVESGLAGVAPVFGVLGISLVIALSGAAFGEMALVYRQTRSPYAVARTYIPTGLFMLWILASLSSRLSWVEATGETLNVGIVQGNIDQGRKFDRAFIQDNLDLYDDLSATLWDADIVLWPETAIPLLEGQPETREVLDYFSTLAKANGASLVSGIFGRGETAARNSILSIGNGSGLYHKQKLVPFGEYVPLRSVFSTLLEIFNLPMSSLEPGPSGQANLVAAGHVLSPFICYEVIYPDFVRRRAKDADLLVTISNDTWFGASWGPLQHLQMAAMRALENGRWMVRGTNNGVSAIINEKGEITVRSEQFRVETLRGEVSMMRGRTPFSYWGSWPVLLLSVLLLIGARTLSPAFLLTLARRVLPVKSNRTHED